MSCNMKLDIFQNHLQSENSNVEENRKTEAKVEEVSKTMTHLHEINEDSSDDSSSSCDFPLREMSVIHDLSVKSRVKRFLVFKEPDISTISVSSKKGGKKEKDIEAPIEVKEEKMTSSTADTNLVDKPKQCTKNDNVDKKPSNAMECQVSKENKDTELPTEDKEISLDGPSSVKELSQPEETVSRPKLDEIFPNSVEGSKLDLVNEPLCVRVVQEQEVVAEKKMKPVSPVPAKKAKVEIPEPSSKENPIPIAEVTSPVATEQDVKKSSLSNPLLPSTSAMDLGDKQPAKKPMPPVAETKQEKTPAKKSLPPVTGTKQAKTNNNVNNIPNPVAVKKEENVAKAETKCPSASPSSKNEDAPVQEKKVNKQRPTANPKPTPSVHQKVPPKESIMAGGECFATVDGIEQETRSTAPAATPRRTSNITQQRSRETGTRTIISRHLNKMRHDKNWRNNHLLLAGGIGIAVVCFYAFYRTKT
ncbi:probable serine/threonine-protein kinase kinX isoform X2 [Halyomorpha halys]|uniref:probable serine/threonine-protein kinase kinX isoform X2 n=1 Tax=Halyomorpha halys TaxID=286706 RepID=UPI0034D2070D